MREVVILAVHLLVTLAKLLRPGGVRAVAAESLLLKQRQPVSATFYRFRRARAFERWNEAVAA